MEQSKHLLSVPPVLSVQPATPLLGGGWPGFSDALHAAMTRTNATLSDLQLLDPHGNLRIVAQVGLSGAFLEHFDQVHAGEAACGTALGHGLPVIVEDVAKSRLFGQPSLRVMLDEGIISVQSIPLKTHSHRIFGVISLLYRRPCEDHARSLEVLENVAARIYVPDFEPPLNLLG